MRKPITAVAMLALLATGAAPPVTGSHETAMKVTRITANLFVDEIEPCVEFWERLGFTRATEVPEGDRLGFVILAHGDVQIMYQSRASVSNDVPALAGTPMGGTLLFIEVDDLDAIERTLGNAPLITPRRTTFYGADELILREPGGNVVTFAQFK